MTYHEICSRYNQRVNQVDKYITKLYSNFTESVQSGFYDNYYIEAQVEDGTKKARKGLIQAFKDFVSNLCDKVKTFVATRKLPAVQKAVAKDPSLAAYVIDDVTDPRVVQAIIKEREKLCDQIVKEYASKGENIDIDKIDDIVTKKQIEMNEKLIKSKKRWKVVDCILAVYNYVKTLAIVNRYNEQSQQLDGENKKIFKASAIIAGGVTARIGTTANIAAVKIQRYINELHKENKLLLSGEIQKLTRECTARVAQPYMPKEEPTDLTTI